MLKRLALRSFAHCFNGNGGVIWSVIFNMALHVQICNNWRSLLGVVEKIQACVFNCKHNLKLWGRKWRNVAPHAPESWSDKSFKPTVWIYYIIHYLHKTENHSSYVLLSALKWMYIRNYWLICRLLVSMLMLLVNFGYFALILFLHGCAK